MHRPRDAPSDAPFASAPPPAGARRASVDGRPARAAHLHPVLHLLVLLGSGVLVTLGATVTEGSRSPTAPLLAASTGRLSPAAVRSVERLVSRWAPLVWLSPGERFMPAGVEDFLKHVTPRAMGAPGRRGQRQAQEGIPQGIPQGPRSAAWYLVSNGSVEELLSNSSSFLYGRDPSASPVPVYAVVTLCDAGRLQQRLEREGGPAGPAGHASREKDRSTENEIPDDDGDDKDVGVDDPLLHVTYWMFFPYNEGKPVCVLDLGPLGPWPLPLLWGTCLGTWRRFGAHVGDWEHVSLFFSGRHHPDAMYVSAHEAGAFYRWAEVRGRGQHGGHLVLERQEVRQGSELLQRAAFPPLARLHRSTGRPELFAAQGSHGLWTRPGAHRYVRVPRLYDHSGYGAPWRTWERLAVLHEGSTSAAGWLSFLGRWGNPRAGCHPLSAAICTQSDGPTGIPLKGRPFSCPAPRAPRAPASAPRHLRRLPRAHAEGLTGRAGALRSLAAVNHA